MAFLDSAFEKHGNKHPLCVIHDGALTGQLRTITTGNTMLKWPVSELRLHMNDKIVSPLQLLDYDAKMIQKWSLASRQEKELVIKPQKYCREYIWRHTRRPR